jgi:acyl transferase domain-containing protein
VLLALKEARARLEAAERAASEPIAVVGIGCRFPGGGNGPDAYRQLLQQGVDAVGAIPADRYDGAAHYSETPGTAGKMYVREGAFLDGIDQFDAAFFGISPREAVSLDPQQRLLLETGWEALEHAGLAPRRLRGSRCGVFMGLGRNDYAYRLLRDAPQDFSAWHATGNGLCYGPGRLAHVLDLKGPTSTCRPR